jgi:hypothetical protein
MLKCVPFRLVVSQLAKVPVEVTVLGLTRMLTQRDMMQQPDLHTWYNFHVCLVVI